MKISLAVLAGNLPLLIESYDSNYFTVGRGADIGCLYLYICLSVCLFVHSHVFVSVLCARLS